MREQTPVVLVPVTPNEDHTSKKGYAVSMVSGAGKIVSSSGERAVAYGVIANGAETTGLSGIALFGAGNVVPVKLASNATSVSEGDYGVMNTDGTFDKDSGSGARIRCVRFTEDGVASETVGALLLDLQSLS